MYCASATLLLLIKVPDLCSCWTDRKIKEVIRKKKIIFGFQGVHTSNIFIHFKIVMKQNKNSIYSITCLSSGSDWLNNQNKIW